MMETRGFFMNQHLYQTQGILQETRFVLSGFEHVFEKQRGSKCNPKTNDKVTEKIQEQFWSGGICLVLFGVKATCFKYFFDSNSKRESYDKSKNEFCNLN